MGDVRLNYVVRADADGLRPGQCTVRGASRDGRFFYALLFVVHRDDRPAETTTIRVLINIGGAFDGHGVGGRTWGFQKVGDGLWSVSPSIDVGPEWHHTPDVVGVPDEPPW